MQFPQENVRMRQQELDGTVETVAVQRSPALHQLHSGQRPPLRRSLSRTRTSILGRRPGSEIQFIEICILNGTTLGPRETDNIIRMITITSYFIEYHTVLQMRPM